MCLRKTRPFFRTKIIVGDGFELSEFYDRRMSADDYAAAENIIREKMLETKRAYLEKIAAEKAAKKKKRKKN